MRGVVGRVSDWMIPLLAVILLIAHQVDPTSILSNSPVLEAPPQQDVAPTEDAQDKATESLTFASMNMLPEPPSTIEPMEKNAAAHAPEPTSAVTPLKPAAREKTVPYTSLIPLKPTQPEAPQLSSGQSEEAMKPPPLKIASNAASTLHRKPARSDSLEGAEIREAEAMLESIEEGKGLNIELSWPSDIFDSRRLYERLVACHGMKSAILVNGDMILSEQRASGTKMRIDLSQHSGYVRYSQAPSLIDAEKRETNAIAVRHGHQAIDAVIRIYPRQQDIELLGRLADVAQGPLDEAGLVTGRYELRGRDLVVTDLVFDGQAASRDIIIPAHGRCR